MRLPIPKRQETAAVQGALRSSQHLGSPVLACFILESSTRIACIPANGGDA